jgi:outer membrane protein, multidrug efflux system
MRPLSITFVALVSLVAADAKQPAPKPVVAIPETFRNQPADAAPARTEAWWKAFGDPVLDELMDRVDKGNLDLRKAASRLAEAQAYRGSAKAALLPSIDSNSSVNRIRGGFSQGVTRIPGRHSGGGTFVSPFETSILSTGLNLRWEADVFGGLRKQLRASKADAEAAAEAAHDARVIVRSELARNYVEMRGLEQQAAVVRAELASEKDLLDLIRVRADAGLATDLEVERQSAQVATTEAVLPELESQRLAAVHRIGVLLGEDPGALRDRLESSGITLRVPGVPAAIPSELLKRRPDVRKAYAEVAAAFARSGAARTEWYPKFVITGLSGRQSTDVGGLTLGAGNFFGAGPGISLPIFSGGRIRSKIAAQDAILEQTLRTCEAEILAAFEETENAYVARKTSEEKQRSLEAAQTATRRSVEIAQELYTRGLGDFLTVLDAQRQQLQIERELVSTHTAVLRNTIALFRALAQ